METHRNKKIVLAGGTGFVGKYFSEQFKALGYQVVIISRNNAHIQWDNHEEIEEALDDAEMLINLAGKSVNCRYNQANKDEILRSRIATTIALGNAIIKCNRPPRIWINSSTATIYRHAMDRPMTENYGEIGSGFSVNVATKWEQAFFDFNLPHTRQIALRMAIVLGAGGGVMKPFVNLVRFGLGGKQGSGKQMFSWIHLEDLFDIVLFLQSQENLSGVFNCSSPNPIDNATLMKALRKEMGVKVGLPSPEWMLKMGAVFIGTETELILKSRWVVPEKLVEAGYQFKFPVIDKALANILKD
ncbi:TIGR01777 family oxidoreductase [Pedobacter ureilyticus]|uniref:TIGR01777 family oxidoreductase n=1 Tax=Pedobacter ureilyticus TaxID=1393051 RepID=A0ABW9J0E4_9SPHI|nr:TIGR01777 family oxidoreductase [Pedobacter helvus]